MATKEKTPERFNHAAYSAKKRVAAKPILDAAAKTWPLERNGLGWKYTTAFVADFLLRERDWVLTGEYVNVRIPLEGYCNRCGEAGSPRGHDILEEMVLAVLGSAVERRCHRPLTWILCLIVRASRLLVSILHMNQKSSRFGILMVKIRVVRNLRLFGIKHTTLIVDVLFALVTKSPNHELSPPPTSSTRSSRAFSKRLSRALTESRICAPSEAATIALIEVYRGYSIWDYKICERANK